MALGAGLTYEKSYVVAQEMLASKYVAGNDSASGWHWADVFSTVFLDALIEHTCNDAVQPLLQAGMVTVGTMMNLTHLAPTPLGMKVTARAKLEAVDGRKLTFSVEIFDEVKKIGDALHERFIVDKAKFAARVKSKAEKIV